jgi:hypothetical protein
MSDEQWVDDSLMLTKLHDLAREQNNKELREIADRFSDLINRAQGRRHWTGNE